MSNQPADRTSMEQRGSERRRNALIATAVLAVVGLIVGVVAWQMSRADTSGDPVTKATASASSESSDGATSTPTPAVPTGPEGYSVFVGAESAKHTVTVYEDLQCPVCASFEAATKDQLAAAVADGTVRMEYRLVSFLDGASTNEYSSRALNAALAVLDTRGAEAFAAYHELLFENQPSEGGPGPDDDQLIASAAQVGASADEIRPAVTGKIYEQWIVNATDQMSKDGVTGTPTVLIDGKRVEGGPQDAVDKIAELLAE